MEPTSQNNDINVIRETRQLFNGFRSNLSPEEINRIREKLNKKEADFNYLKEKEQEHSLMNKEKKELENIGQYLKNIVKHFTNLKSYIKELQKYQYVIDYLFNEHNEEGYTANSDINAFKEARKLLNECKSNLLRKETNEIKKKLNKKEVRQIYKREC